MSRTPEEVLRILRGEQPAQPVSPQTEAVRILQEQQAAERAKRNVLDFATQRNPDEFSNVLRASERLGMDPATAEFIPSEVNRQLKQQDILAVMRGDATVADFFTKHTQHLTVAQDELSVFKELGEFARELIFAPSTGAAGLLGGTLGVGEAATRAVGADTIADFLAGPRQTMGEIQATLRGEQETLSGFESAVLSGVESTVQNIPGLIAGALGAGAVPVVLGIGAIAGGNKYGEALEEGLSPNEALVSAIGEGGVEAATELIPMGRLFGDILGNSSVRRMIINQMATEIPGEQAATLLQDALDWQLLPSNADKTLQDYLAERPDAAFQTLVATMVGTGLMTGAIALTDTVGGIQDGQAQADTAIANHERLTQINTLLSEAQTRSRSPETIRAYTQQFGGEVTISADELIDILNRHGVSLDDVRNAVPAIDEQIDNAFALGGDVTIPVSEWAAGMTGEEYSQDVVDNLRTNPQGPTGLEAQEFAGQAEEAFNEQARQAIADEEVKQRFVDERTDIETGVTEQLVQANPSVYAEQGSAEATAALAGGFYEATAHLLGLTPQEVFNRYPVQITGAAPVSPQTEFEFEQAAAREQAGFDEFFEGSQVVDEQGNPQQLVHTTPAEFTAFSDVGLGQHFGTPEAANERAEAVAAGQPVLPEEDTSFDVVEGTRSIPVFLNISNPLRLEDNNWLSSLSVITQVIEASGRTPELQPILARLGELSDRIIDQREEAGLALAQFTPADRSAILRDEGRRVPAEATPFTESDANKQAFDEIKALLQEAGFDGIVYENSVEDRGSDSFIPFDPGQIKSSIGNVGTFDRANPDILFQDPQLTELQDRVDRFNIERGRARIVASREPVDIENSKRISNAYDAMEHAPDDPAVQASYKALVAGVEEQFKFMTEELGITVEFTDNYQPYESSQDMAQDVRDNQHLTIWQGGDPHSLLDGEQNARFRAVHDFFGHVMHDNSFGHQGEEQAWRVHAQMFPDEALGALATETRGQNSAVHFSPTVDNDIELLNVDSLDAGLRFVEQKAGLLPEEFWRPPVTELEQGQRRGAIQFDPTGALITLTENADLSTAIHELGHLFFQMWSDIAAQPNAPQQIRDDVNALLDWYGVKDMAEWNSLSTEDKRKHHEKFAVGFEKFLFQGKAPTPELRPLFQQFRAWLRRVYKSLKNLGVELTPEVEQIMGRMVGAEQLIEVAEQQRLLTPMFESRDMAGMTEDEWSDYQALDVEGTERAIENLGKRSLRDMKWLTGARNRELKRLQNEVASLREAAKAEAEAEITAQPIRQAEKFLKTGVALFNGDDIDYSNKPHRLSTEALSEMYNPANIEEGTFPREWINLPLGRNGLRQAKGGLHPDFVAPLFGIASGDHLVRRLLELTPLEQEIEALTDQIMLERHGDLTQPEAMDRAVDIALHNDARVRMAAIELKFLDESFNTNELLKAARIFTENAVQREKVGRLSSKKFSSAATRSAKSALRELQAGNRVLAAMHKRNQILNEMAASKAAKAEERISNWERYRRKYTKKSTAVRIGPDTVEQIHGIEATVGLHDPVELRQPLEEWITEQSALGFVPDVPIWWGSKKFAFADDMTVREHGELMDFIRSMEQAGRNRGKKLTGDRNARLSDITEELARTTLDNTDKRIPQDETAPSGALQKMKGIALSGRYFDSILREMDGWTEGAWWKALVQPKNAAANFALDKTTEGLAKLNELFKTLDDGPAMSSKMAVPGVSDGLTRNARIMVGVYAGTDASYQRLIDGGIVGGPKNLTPDQIQAILNTLTKPETDFIQAVWEFNESLRPEIAAKEKRVLGYVPKWVAPREVQTRHGTLRGGYMRIIYDPRKSSFDQDSDTTVQNMVSTGQYTYATTDRGHTKDRLQAVKGMPLRLDVGNIPQAFSRAVHDLAWHEWAIDARRIIRDPAVRDAIVTAKGDHVWNQLREEIDIFTRGELGSGSAVDSFFSHIRKGTAVATLAFNATSGIIQILGLTQAIPRLGVKYFAVGLMRTMGSAVKLENVFRDVQSRSLMMRQRLKSQTREFQEFRRRSITTSKAKRKAQSAFDKMVNDIGFAHIRYIQYLADTIIFLGAEAKAADAGADPITAVASAEQAVTDTQGSGALTDRTALEKSQIGQAMSLFATFFTRTWGTHLEIKGRAQQMGALKGVPWAAFHYGMLVSVPAAFSQIMFAVLRAEDPEEELTPGAFAEEMAAYAISAVPYARELGGAIQGFDYKGPAAFRAFSDLSTLLEQSLQVAQGGEFDEAFWDALLRSGGTMMQFPAGFIDRSISGLIEYMEEQENPEQIIFGPKVETR